MLLIIDGIKAVLPQNFSLEYVSENRSFTDADDYTLSLNLPLAGCPQNKKIFGYINRKDFGSRKITKIAEIIDKGISKRGVVTVVDVSEVDVKVQFLEGRSVQNFVDDFDDVFINELDLGIVRTWKNNPSEILRSIDSGAEMVALPWMYEESIQNNIIYDEENQMQWGEDTSTLRKLSCQPYLLTVAKRICEAVQYSYDFLPWEQSPERYLIVCNTLPAEWSLPEMARVLPHWSVSEFFEELEKILVCEFSIDHGNKHITMLMNSDVDWANVEVKISNVVESFSSEIANDSNLCKYKGSTNFRYKKQSNIRWKIDDCQWFVDDMREWGYRYIEFDTSDDYAVWVHDHYDMLHQGLYKDIKRDQDAGYLMYIKDSGKYFLYVVTQGYNSYYFYVETAVNRFGPQINDPNSSEFVELNCVPAIMDVSASGVRTLLMEPVSIAEDGADADEDAPLQPTAYSIFLKGEPTESIEFYDCIHLAYWDGHSSNSSMNPPAPVVDYKFSLDNRYHGYNGGLKINNNEKLKFSWIGDKVPNVRSIFYINGRRYLCEKITATFTEDGMSQLLKGEFFAITD